MGAEFGPGLSVPVSVPPSGLIPYFPSHLNSSRMRCSLVRFSRHSPLQLPLSGWPNCANAGMAIARHASRHTKRRRLPCMYPPWLLTLLIVLPVIDDIFPEIVFQVIKVLVVFLADVFPDSIAGPGNVPRGS